MEKADHHFYGRRKGKKLRKGLSESLQHDFFVADALLKQPKIIPSTIFGNLKLGQIWVEIGFGSGEHLINQALQNPDVGIIGCEPFINGVAACAREVLEKNIDTVRFYADDAMHLLTRFPAASLDKVFLLFPDPWPKTKHHKRRFIQSHTVALFAHVLKQGGQLVLATDDRNLAEWMLMHTVLNDHFAWNNATDAQWSTPPADWVGTRYQQKAALQGRPAHFLNFTKI